MSKVAHFEPYLTWEQIGERLAGASKRWLEQRVAEGMPSSKIAGRRCFQESKVFPWLAEHGYIEDTEAA